VFPKTSRVVPTGLVAREAAQIKFTVTAGNRGKQDWLRFTETFKDGGLGERVGQGSRSQTKGNKGRQRGKRLDNGENFKSFYGFENWG